MQVAVMGIARHLLTILSGMLTTRGVIGESDAEILVGATLGIVGVVWSIIEKRTR